MVTSWLAHETGVAAASKNTQRLHLAAAALFHLHDWYCKLETAGRYLSNTAACRKLSLSLFFLGGLGFLEPCGTQEAQAIQDTGLKHLDTYVKLARLAIRDRRLAWQLRPKHHVFHHILLDTKKYLQNPRKTHCFRGEAAMQLAKSDPASSALIHSRF